MYEPCDTSNSTTKAVVLQHKNFDGLRAGYLQAVII